MSPKITVWGHYFMHRKEESSQVHPDSILGNTSLTKDFVVNSESYFILEGNTLTVFENGETQTY